MKIKEYKVFSEDGLDNINDVIQSLVEEGWEPMGGISCTISQTKTDGMAVMYSQAMVFPKPEQA